MRLLRPTALAATLLVACGARSDLEIAGREAGAGPVEGCVAGSLPRVGEVTRHDHGEGPARGAAVFVLDESRALLVGGLSSTGVYADGVSLLDLRTLENRRVPVTGDGVQLPTAAGVAWDAARGRGYVVGGTRGRADLAQVFAVSFDGESARITRLDDYPAGGVYAPAVAFDSRRGRVVAKSRIYGDPPTREEHDTTWVLEGERWRPLVPSGGAPTEPGAGAVWTMAYDPAADRMVLADTGTRTETGAIHVLDLADPSAWRSVPGRLPSAVVTWPTFVWDPASCGFFFLARAEDSACSFDLHLARIEDRLELTPLGSWEGERGGSNGGSLIHDAARGRLLVVGPDNCSMSGFFLDTTEVVALAR